MELDPCKYCDFIGNNKSETSAHIHKIHMGMNCYNYHCWTCSISFNKESGMKRHNSTVKHLLEVKRFKESTTTSTLWDLTPPEERYLTYIDRIDDEQIQPKPVKHFKGVSRNHVGLKPVEIPLKRRGFTKDPRPGVGRYKQIKPTTQDKDSPALFPTPDNPDVPPIIIKEKDNTLTYIPDQIADELVSNLINFLDNNPNTEVIFEEEDVMQDVPKTPEITFPEEDLVDLITDESWLMLDAIGETPAPEDIFPTNDEDFKDFIY